MPRAGVSRNVEIEFSVGFAETEMPGGIPGFVFISIET